MSGERFGRKTKQPASEQEEVAFAATLGRTKVRSVELSGQQLSGQAMPFRTELGKFVVVGFVGHGHFSFLSVLLTCVLYTIVKTCQVT